MSFRARKKRKEKKRRIKVFLCEPKTENEDSKPAPLKVYEKKNSAFAHRPTAKKKCHTFVLIDKTNLSIRVRYVNARKTGPADVTTVIEENKNLIESRLN